MTSAADGIGATAELPLGRDAPSPGRHPLDPDPVASTKATAVLVLGVVAVSPVRWSAA